MLEGVQLTYQKIKVHIRRVVVKKNGTESFGQWDESQAETSKLIEDAFSGFSTGVPILQGKLLKKSPNAFKAVITGFKARSPGALITGFKGEYQERCCIVREGHLIWWDPAKVQMPTASDSDTTRRQKEAVQVQGMISFLLNRAKVEKVDHETIKVLPASPSGWADSSSFTGGCSREMTFQVGTVDGLGRDHHSVEDWVDAIRKNIEFGDKAFAQLGAERIIEEVGNDQPQLRQAIWRKPKA